MNSLLRVSLYKIVHFNMRDNNSEVSKVHFLYAQVFWFSLSLSPADYFSNICIGVVTKQIVLLDQTLIELLNW